MLTTETQTYKALMAVKTHCDRAHSQDGAGFSGYDAGFAHDLLDKGTKWGWTEKQFSAATRLAHKYRKQIAALGYEPAVIAIEAAPMVRQRERAPEVFQTVKFYSVKSETEKALILRTSERDRGGVCIPKSQIKSSVMGGQGMIYLVLPDWVIRTKKLAAFVDGPTETVQPVATPPAESMEAAIEVEREFRSRRLLDV